MKNVIGRVWHASLLAIVRKYNISANLFCIVEQLNDKATSAIQINGSTGGCYFFLRTTVGVWRGCIL